MAEQASIEDVQVGVGENVCPKPPNIRKTLNGTLSLDEIKEQKN